jgi:succinylglutamic semialdehyde dehydrogenase
MSARVGGPIAGRGRLSGERFFAPTTIRGELLSRSPADPDDVIGSFPYGVEDVSEAVVIAARAARPWGQESVATRVRALSGLRTELVRSAGELALCLIRETGRPAWECQREVQGLIGRLDQLCAIAESVLADRGPEDLPGRVRSLPLGTVAVISPAMLPLATGHTHIIAALLAGNSVVWKPSPLCPASAQRYAEIVWRSALPAGVFNMVQGDDRVGFELGTHPQVDGVVFTGRAAAGQRLRQATAERYDLALVLHLSGKNAAIVMEDADLGAAAYEVVTSAMLSTGQRCTATSRVLVHESVLAEFTDLLLAQLDALRVGPPIPVAATLGAGAGSSNDEPFMGPMLSAARLETFLADCASAKTSGAEPLRPSGRLGGPLAHGYFVSPSLHLIRQRQPTSRYQREELLGPDLALYPVVDIDDALQLCDSGPYGLCAAMFTESPLRWKRFSEEVRAGSLFWNRGTAAPSGRLPFGGVKGSGYGGRGGADALLALRREVSLLGQSRATPERLPGSEPLPSPPRRSESEA